MMSRSVAKWRRRSGAIFAALAAALRLLSWRSTLKASCSRPSSIGFGDCRFAETLTASLGLGWPRAWLGETRPFAAPRAMRRSIFRFDSPVILFPAMMIL